MPDAAYLVGITTTDSEDAAATLAEGLVRNELAACVQISSPIKSVYRWKGEIETDTEWQLWIKTRSDLADTVTAWIREHHSYDVPELVFMPVTAGNPEYLKWIIDETRSVQP
ncbi:divalent-cation tolerance protein CutA [Kribbella sp. NPDC050124]|uniref:divalent-cation tolerance protein CutA n=1 Tax=Kribbella sp. NPDC050124 TaxID=3364114 RepID=UPI0037B80F18